MRCAGEFLSGVLQEDRHSGARSVEERDDDGIDDRVEPFDGLGDTSTKLFGAQCAALQLADLLHRAHPPNFFHQLSLSQARLVTFIAVRAADGASDSKLVRDGLNQAVVKHHRSGGLGHLFVGFSEPERLHSVPSLSGSIEVNLTVRDPASSAAWYSELLNLEVLYDFAAEDSRMHYVALLEPHSQLVLCLVGHHEHSGEPFSEFRTGLDHLEFLVDRREDLDEWAERLNRLEIPHSGVKEPDYTRKRHA